MRAFPWRAAPVLVALLVPGAGVAQVANPLPRATAMSGSFTALARGLSAPAWNPAGLGMPDNPAFSVSLLPLGFSSGLSPIGMSDLADYDGAFVPRATRIDWLQQIRNAGGEKGTFGADVTYLAFSVGQFAFTASSSARGRVNMAPDVAEVFFFGNAGLSGEPVDLSLAGSSFDAAGTTTFAGSFAVPLSVAIGPLPDQHFSVGATVKYTIGNFLALGRESQSTLSTEPLMVNVRFPMIHTPFTDDSLDQSTGDVLNNGSGFGIDVGAAWQGGIFSAGLTVRNLINTFDWDLDGLRFRQGAGTWNADTSYTDFTESDIGDAPPELVDRVETLYTFSPVLAVGAAAQVTPSLKVTGEIRHSLDDNLIADARSHMGVGAELTVLPVLPVRAGLAIITGGYQLSGGVGLNLGPLQLSFAAAARETDLGSDAVGAIGLAVGM